MLKLLRNKIGQSTFQALMGVAFLSVFAFGITQVANNLSVASAHDSNTSHSQFIADWITTVLHEPDLCAAVLGGQSASAGLNFGSGYVQGRCRSRIAIRR